jgi:hypothetical protein
MQKLKFATLAALFIAVTFSSCKKDDDTNNVTDPPTGQNIYLDKIFEVYDDGNGLDTQYVMTFEYDAQKRISRWGLNDAIFGGEYIATNYLYNNNDTVPYGFTQINYEMSGGAIPDTIRALFTFNSNGKISGEFARITSASFPEQRSTTLYQYVGSQRFGATADTTFGTPNSITRGLDTSNFDGNGNFVSSVQYETVASLGMQLKSRSFFSFDSRVNPLALQNIGRVHQATPYGETAFFDYMSYNNIASRREFSFAFSNDPLVDANYVNTYDANGRITRSVITDAATGSFSPITMTYTYKNL